MPRAARRAARSPRSRPGRRREARVPVPGPGLAGRRHGPGARRGVPRRARRVRRRPTTCSASRSPTSAGTGPRRRSSAPRTRSPRCSRTASPRCGCRSRAGLDARVRRRALARRVQRVRRRRLARRSTTRSRLVRRRGELMAQAGDRAGRARWPRSSGSTPRRSRRRARGGRRPASCVAANFNSPGPGRDLGRARRGRGRDGALQGEGREARDPPRR